jgi:hypothetical protein
MNQMDVLESLVAERDINRTLADYCGAVDRCDLEALLAVYHPGAQVDYGELFKGSAADHSQWGVQMLSENYDSTMHVVSNVRIDFDADGARVHSYIVAYHEKRADNGDTPHVDIFAGRYLDRFEERDGEWKISDRLLIGEWDTKVLVSPAFPPDTFVRGQRGQLDPSYAG